jgi:hypothetical protein
MHKQELWVFCIQKCAAPHLDHARFGMRSDTPDSAHGALSGLRWSAFADHDTVFVYVSAVAARLRGP